MAKQNKIKKPDLTVNKKVNKKYTHKKNLFGAFEIKILNNFKNNFKYIKFGRSVQTNLPIKEDLILVTRANSEEKERFKSKS